METGTVFDSKGKNSEKKIEAGLMLSVFFLI